MERKVLSIILTLLIAVSVISCALTQPKQSDIVVLYTNDIHCAVDAGKESMGFAGVAGYYGWIKQNYQNSALVDCGDAIQGEALGTLSDGQYIVDIMNAVGYDFCTYGNHEFDYKIGQLRSLVASAQAHYLSCNFTNLKTGNTVSAPYEIVRYGSVKIAYLGISTPESITKSTPTYFQDENGNFIYGFCQGDNGQELYNTVQKNIDAARRNGADYVVALAHLGVDDSSAPFRSEDVIANTTGLDVVLDGHSHTVMAQENINDKCGKSVLLSSTGTKLENLGELMINTNGTANVKDDTLSTKLVSYSDINSNELYKNDNYNCVSGVINDIEAQFKEKLSQVVATSQVELSVNDSEGIRAVRNRETNIGDFAADAYRAVSGADIAFVNGGGIRDSIDKGDVTYEEIFNVHPYNNKLDVVEATGQEIADALEMSMRNVASKSVEGGKAYNENGGFLQVSGLKFTVDTSISSSVSLDENKMFQSVTGERRVKDIQVLGADGSYSALDLNKKYTVVASEYMLISSGDGINMFADNNILSQGFILDNQALIEYSSVNLGGVIGTEYQAAQGRITII